MEPPGPSDLIESFFVSSVQGGIVYCEELLDAIQSVRTKALPSYEFDGNAHSLEMNIEGVSLHDEYAIPDLGIAHLSLEDFEEYVIAWRSLVEEYNRRNP